MVELFTLQKLGRQKEALVEALKEGQAESVVFGRQAMLGGAGGWEGGMGGGMQGGGGGQRKSNHKKGQMSLPRQGSGQHMGGGGGEGRCICSSNSSCIIREWRTIRVFPRQKTGSGKDKEEGGKEGEGGVSRGASFKVEAKEG